jgi:integrase
MTRRDFGTVRRLPSGRWQARYQTPADDRVTAPQTFQTRAAAATYLAKVQTDMDRGDWLDPTVAKQTFAEYATPWLADRADLRPRTAELYRELLNRHLIPHLGDVPLSQLSPSVVRQWHAGRLRADVGRSTVAKAYRLLKTILNTAVADEVLPRNPCMLRGAGSERTPERDPPTLAEAHALAEAIEPRWRMLVLLATWSGLRWGELVALRRSSIDVAGGRLAVTGQLIETQHGRELGPPKTDAGRRTVHLPPHLMPELVDHLNRWVGPEAEAWLFCGPLGAPLARRNFTTHWTRARTGAGLPSVRFHDLRHLSATLAATTGASTRELMARMGHSSARAALIYQHATTDRDQAVAKAMSALAVSAGPRVGGSTRRRRRTETSPDQLTLDDA